MWKQIRLFGAQAGEGGPLLTLERLRVDSGYFLNVCLEAHLGSFRGPFRDF